MNEKNIGATIATIRLPRITCAVTVSLFAPRIHDITTDDAATGHMIAMSTPWAIISSALIIAGLCIAIASRSKSFKEAQSALQPIQFLVLVPLLLPMAGVETNFLISIIPMVGQGMLLNDLFGNGVTYLNVISMFISSIIFIVLIILIISKQYKSEKVLFF